MGHPKVADCGVIGVPTVDGSNELVRWGNNMSDEVQLKMLADKHFNIRAYIAPKDSALLKSQIFVVEIQEWVKEKASKHQQLHGGTFFLSIYPRGWAILSCLPLSFSLSCVLGSLFRFLHKQAT